MDRLDMHDRIQARVDSFADRKLARGQICCFIAVRAAVLGGTGRHDSQGTRPWGVAFVFFKSQVLLSELQANFKLKTATRFVREC